jgi:hypothetical protein
MGYQLADEIGLPLDDETGHERCVLVVRGARARRSAEIAAQKAG